ncbi:MAG: ATP-binding cassette domain-containing protein, partial [Lachnospiraceae bacterium]|nr:ATP-binding cassette domain-containing protein [Lachnospiraceae bacterium]
DMHIDRGEIYGFIGQNGAGKTTLMKVICGLANKSSGSFRLFDSEDIRKGRENIGCVIEQPALFPKMTGMDNLLYYAKLKGCEKTTDFFGLLQLVGLADTGKMKAGRFSLGMKQRLSIAIAMLGEPEFLILDEPMNGLDPMGIHQFRELFLRLRGQGITILISSHILGELEKIATKYGIINQGILVDEFSVKELQSKLTQYLRIHVNDVEKAVEVIGVHWPEFTIKQTPEGMLTLCGVSGQAAEINAALIREGIEVSHLAMEGQDMESYFLERMGTGNAKYH